MPIAQMYQIHDSRLNGVAIMEVGRCLTIPGPG